MDVWIGAEVDRSVGEQLRLARNRVEDTVKAALASRDYGIPLDSLDCIAIIRDDAKFAEIHRYSAAKRDMGFRLAVDHGAFLAASPERQQSMIFSLLVRSVRILRDKGVEGDLSRLEADLLA